MPLKQNTADDLIIALRDPRVLEAIAGIFQSKLQPLINSITELKEESARKSSQIIKLQSDLQSMSSRVVALESYTRRDNLLITGIPANSYAEASATADAEESQPSQSVEQSVLNLFNQQLASPSSQATFLSPTD
jgi:hypothetical protein